MVSIHAALLRIKDDWRAVLAESHIERVCREAGLKWRKRVLDPVTTILVFFLQVLHRNTAITNLPRLAGKRFTPAAYCQARRRLPLTALRRLLLESGAPLRVSDESTSPPSPALWRGHRVFLLDASSCSMPDTPSLQKRFGQPGGQKKGCGFPVAHLLMLVDAHSGLILDVLISPLRTHDLRRAAELHPHLQAGDVAVADRAYGSYAHVATLHRQGVFVVFRLHQKLRTDRLRQFPRARSGRRKQWPAFELLGTFGPGDRLVLWNKPVPPPQTMPPDRYAALPADLIVRIVQYTITRPGYRTRRVTLLTTLLDPQTYPAEALAELYGRRWQIELNFRHLKQTLGLDVLHCKTPDGVEKEIVMFALVYNLVRAVMLAEAQRRGVCPDRISFVDALRHLSWPLLQPDVLLVINPLRPDRVEPRVRKRRPKQYPLMQEPRDVLRKRLLRKERAA
jgi:hypothetical protein